MHNTDNRGTRYSLLAAGFVASLIALVGSCVLNFRYGHALARTPEDGLIFGMLAIASDVFMAASLFFYFEARKKRQFAMMAASLVVWLATTAFAGIAAISQASINRIDAVAHRTAVNTQYADTREELTQARKERGFIPQHRPEATVQAEMERHKTGRYWSLTNECTDPNGKIAREFCAQYQVLKAELGFAQQTSKLEKRISDLVARSDQAATTHVGVASEADPAAATLAGATGYSQRSVQTAIIFGFSGLMLVLCSLGPYITSSMLHAYDRKIITLDASATATSSFWPPEPVQAVKLDGAKPLAIAPPPKPKGGKAPPQLRAEPSPEWRDLLTALDFPAPGWTPPRDKRGNFILRGKDPKATAGFRFWVWLLAHNETGQFTPERLGELYEESNKIDFRASWAYRIVTNRMRGINGKWVSGKGNPVVWTISSVPIAKVKETLAKRKVPLLVPPTEKVIPDEKEANRGSVIPFGEDVLHGKPQAANDTEPPKRRAVQGWAELNRLMPDLEGLRRLERVNKATWQAKAWTMHRKQQNRLSRARAA